MLCDTGTSGQAIADKIKFTLEKLTLDLNDLRGQGYDGEGNMPGKYRGAAAIIQHDHSKALYVHCVSHVLNLCVVAACSIAYRQFRTCMELWRKSASSATIPQNGNKRSYKSILKFYQLEPLVKQNS